MGDLFFILRMSVYTIIIVLVMQIKIGPNTVEDQVIHFTHKSQFAGVIQEFAQGAVSFLGVQYNNLAGKVNTKFFNTHGQEQAPGKRLESRLGRFKNSIRSRVNDESGNIKKGVHDTREGIEDVSEQIDDKSKELKESISEYEI